MVDRLTPENIEQYGITWDELLNHVDVCFEDGVFVDIDHTNCQNKSIYGRWLVGHDMQPKEGGAIDLYDIHSFVLLVGDLPEPKTIQIFHEPIKPSKSAALSYADTLVSNVKSMLEAGNITEDEAFSMLEQAAAAQQMSKKAFEELRDYLGKRKGQNYLYSSGSKFEVKGGSKMNFDYSKCDSIKEFDEEIKRIEAQLKSITDAKSAKERQISSAYLAGRYDDLKRITEDGVELTDIPTPIPGSTTYAFTLAK